MESLLDCIEEEFSSISSNENVENSMDRHRERAKVHNTKSGFLGFTVHVLGCKFIQIFVRCFLIVL